MQSKWFVALAAVAILVALIAAAIPMTGGGRALDAPSYMPPKPGAEPLELPLFPANATPAEVRNLIKAEILARMAGARMEPGGPNPRMLERLQQREEFFFHGRGVGVGYAKLEPLPPIAGTANLLVLTVEFSETDSFGDPPVTIEGPLHNEISAPGSLDNNTFWVGDFSQSHYDDLLFDTGSSGGVGTVRTDLNGGIDLSGLTLANYYDEVSSGVFGITGDVVDWVSVDHSEGFYGADSATGTDDLNGPVWQLTIDTIDAVNAAYPGFDWAAYDQTDLWDDDGDSNYNEPNCFIDHLLVIHAGVGQEAGGGAQGDYAIWSHSWDVNAVAGGYAIPESTCDNGGPIYALNYTMMPEDGALGVFAHEFGHDLGLPDLYSFDAENGIGNWDLMAAGSWNGPLGGASPAHMGLWDKWMLGWADPLVVSTDSLVTLGETELTPASTEKGIRINLPDQEEDVTNPLGTGDAYWSTKGNNLDTMLTASFDLTGTTDPVTLTVQSWLDAETLWDYGYFEVSTDGGTTWVGLADSTVPQLCTTDNPNGTLLPDHCGYTGFIGENFAEGTNAITFDLSAYDGPVDVRFRYVTDAAVQGLGWFLDDLTLVDADGTIDYDDGTGVWDLAGWMEIPFTAIYPQYYLAEWRNASGFDEGLAYPYRTLFFDADEWMVERTPYTVPGMLLWYRNFKYSDNFFIGASLFDDPSWGAKGMLLVVDSHPQPLRFSQGPPAPGALNLGGRNQPSNATFGLIKTTRFRLTQSLGLPQQKMFGNESPVSVFDDAQGYYPGIETFQGFGFFVDFDASVVVPATSPYPVYWPGVCVPSNFCGNPGPFAYGVMIEVEDQAGDGSWGDVSISFSP